MRNLKKTIAISILMIIVIIISCKKDSNPTITEQADTPYNLDIGAFPPPAIAGDNPLTREGVKLGRMLFYEKKLSRTNTQSCASCHIQ